MHITRFNVPKTWKISNVKGIKWITNIIPGPHSIQNSMPINLVLKELLNYTKTTRESKRIIAEKKVLVNKKIIKELKYPVGLFDVIEFPNANEIYRFSFGNDERFTVKKIKKEEGNLRPCKVISKTLQRKGVMQINLDNGFNLLTDKKDIKMGDTIIVNLENKKIVKHLKFDVGSLVMITDGKYIGQTGKIKEIKTGLMGKKNVKIKVDKEEIETFGGYAFVLDDSISY
ncbi:30S ribosomal protein S4e [Candidatus Woesearchaeota archaeon]|nr:30S ribosomal protein S4e [Candidatus Woesearchaeota archaeon]